MTEVQTNSGEKLHMCALPQNEDLTATQYTALPYVQVKKVGSLGERGINTNVVSYDTMDTVVSLKGKGITNAGDPTVEVAEDLSDTGQTAMRAACSPFVNDSYAFKIERSDGTLEYWRGLAGGPNVPGGRNEDFRLNNFTVALNQPPVTVVAPVTPQAQRCLAQLA